MLNVAFVAAVFASGVAVCCKCISAFRAGKFINSLPVQPLRMVLPPFHSAFVTAEQFLFPLRALHNHSSAVLAVCHSLRKRCFTVLFHTVPPAVGLYCVPVDSCQLGNLSIAESFTPKVADDFFLFFIHSLFPFIDMLSVNNPPGEICSSSHPETRIQFSVPDVPIFL